MTPAFESGVQSYVVGIHTVEVPFPVNWRGEPDVRCELCRYYSRTGRRCHLNGEVVEYPEKYIGSKCPLKFTEEE